MGNLTEESKKLIKEEVNEAIKDFTVVIFFLNAYKWIIGFLLVAFGIGTFIGLDILISNKVNQNIRAYDNFINAEMYITKDQYAKAFNEMVPAWKKIETENLDSPELREIYYSDMVTICSNTIEYDKYKKIFRGQNAWNELKKRADFREFIENYSGNFYTNLDNSFCQIKFENSNIARMELDRIIQISADQDLSLKSHRHDETYDRLWYPFMACLVKNDINAAKQYLARIDDEYPEALNKYFIKGKVKIDVVDLIYWNNIDHKLNGRDNNLFVKFQKIAAK